MDMFIILTTISIFCGVTGFFMGLVGLLYSILKTNNLKNEILTQSEKNLKEGLEELRSVSQNDAIALFNHFLDRGPESTNPLKDFSFRDM